MAGNKTQPWYKRGLKARNYFQNTPLRRLRMLFLAVFLLFSTIGFFSDLLSLGHLPWPIVIFNAVASGIISVLYVLIGMRYLRMFILPLSILQALFWLADGSLISLVMRHHLLQPMTTEAGVRFAAVGTLIGAISSYTFFLGFIRSQGSDFFRLQNELELAHGIQQTLVPAVSLRTSRFEVYGISRPSEKVGGDLVDAIVLPDGDSIVYCADIAGHGLAAGILMGMLKTATRTALLDGQCTLPGLFERLNRVLPGVKEPHMYATCTALRLGTEGTVEYALAASPPLLHWRGSKRQLGIIKDSQFPLGLLPAVEFSGSNMRLLPGDLLVVATDGLIEVCNATEQEFGVEQLCLLVGRHAQAPLDKLANELLTTVNAWGKQIDDQTVLLVRCMECEKN